MKTIPGGAAARIGAHDEEIFVLDPFDEGGRPRLFRDRLGELGIEPAANRERFHEGRHVFGKMADDIFPEIILQVRRVPRHVAQVCSRFRPVFEHDRNELEAGGPAVRLVVDQTDLVGFQLQPLRVLVKEGAGFGAAEREVVAFDFGDLPHHAQPPDAERRQGSRREGDVKVAGAVIEQLLHQLMGSRILDMMIIVEHQVEFTVHRRDIVDDRGHRLVDLVTIVLGQKQVVLDRHAEPPERGENVRAEAGEQPLVGVKREPGNLRTRRHQPLSPLGEQGRLAEPGAARHENEARLTLAGERFEQRLAQHIARPDPRRRELRRDEQFFKIGRELWR